MGLDIEVLIVDWARVEAAAPGDRDDLLTDAAFGEDDDDLFAHGWTWPAQPGEDWYGRYAFRQVRAAWRSFFGTG